MKLKILLQISATLITISTAHLITSCSTAPVILEQAPAPAIDTTPTKNLGATSQRIQQPRPGIGTGWGSEISSDLNYRTFHRASSKPAGVASIYYNDKEGVKAMTKHQWKTPSKGMQKAAGGLVSWGVKSTWGSLKNYRSHTKRFIVGRKNQEYAIVVKNNAQSALEVILSVDGLDVMDGKSASFKKRGYIIPANETLSIKGFRTSESALAAFKFSSVSNSYTNMKHGNTRNVGVIGLAVFTQKGVNPWKWSHQEVYNRQSARAFAEAPNISAR